MDSYQQWQKSDRQLLGLTAISSQKAFLFSNKRSKKVSSSLKSEYEYRFRAFIKSQGKDTIIWVRWIKENFKRETRYIRWITKIITGGINKYIETQVKAKLY